MSADDRWALLRAARARVWRRGELEALDVLDEPVWVLDVAHLEHWWGNSAALGLWGKPTRAAFLAREQGSTMSAATRTRLEGILARVDAGEAVRERWTFYPDGRAPRPCDCTFSPLRIADDRSDAPRRALLIEGRVADEPPAQRRSVEALRHCGEMISLYTPEGAVLLRNPAALRTLGDPLEAAGDRFAAALVDPALAPEIRAALARGEVFRADLRVRTLAGEAWHDLEARATLDPVTGAPAALVIQRDVGEKIAQTEALREAHATVLAQSDELTRLAAPVLNLGQGVLALPLIGRVDRARLAAAGDALAALGPRAALRLVVFDLTGALALGADAALALRDAARRLRLQGIEAALSGLRPELVRALVTGVEGLGELVVYRDLEAALAAHAVLTPAAR